MMHAIKLQVMSSQANFFIVPNITNLPQGASQSVLHMTPSVLRPSIRMEKLSKKKFNVEEVEETSGEAMKDM